MRQSGGFCYTELNAYLVKYYKAILSKANLNVAAVKNVITKCDQCYGKKPSPVRD